jgi:hypothetical protein
MRAFSRFFLAGTLLALNANVPMAADTLPLVAGLWQVTTMPEFKGIPANPTPRIDRFCLDEAAIKAGRIPLRLAVTCKIPGGKWEANKLTLTIVCDDAPPDTPIANQISAEGQGLAGFITLNPAITYRYAGKWLAAECR